MVKADQPAHRCVQHLLLLMIRTIERVGREGREAVEMAICA